MAISYKKLCNQLITDIEQEMLAHLDNHQMEQFHKVLAHYLRDCSNASSE